jgi:hypothetical protein
MEHINILVLGHQLSDPVQWVLYLADRFQQPITHEVFHEPDRCLVVELTTGGYHMVTKGPVYALLDKEESYRILLAQPVDVVLYFQSVFASKLHVIQRDFDIISPLLAVHPTRPPVFTVLNDIYCGRNLETRLSSDQLNQYRIPESCVFETSISSPSESMGCAEGADEVFEALLDVLDCMKT